MFALNTSTQAQQFTTVDLFDVNSSIGFGRNGYYYKDVNNYLNQFVGTWSDVINTGGYPYEVYEFRFVKKTFIKSTPNGSIYKLDALVGEMRMLKQGTEIYNGFNNLNQNYNSNTQYNIYSSIRVGNGNCNNCTTRLTND